MIQFTAFFPDKVFLISLFKLIEKTRKKVPGIQQNNWLVVYSQLLQGNAQKALEFFELAASHDPNSAWITANTELAVNMLGYDTRRSPREGVAVVELAEVKTPKMWIEKTAERVHTLVTRPDPEFLERVAQMQVDPRIVSLGGARQR